jgi:PhoH-like ATPase
MGENKRLYVLDTNVLMHDPTSMFRFEEHDVFLPMIVLEELDAAKTGLTEVSRNVRQVSRFIGDMMNSQGAGQLEDGLELRIPHGLDLPCTRGRLYFQTSPSGTHPSLLSEGSFADNEILSTALSLQESEKYHEIILISKDINLRIKAAILNVPAEDYYNDRALDDVDLLYKGMRVDDDTFWQRYPQVDSWSENGST